MRPHPRPPIIRKTIKWGGAAVTMLLVVVWLGSGWWNLRWVSNRFLFVNVIAGCITVGRLNDNGRDSGWRSDEWTLDPARTQFRWIPRCGTIQAGGWFVDLPTVFLLATSAIATAAAWRLDTLAHRRARLNFCPKCNYDRTGLAPRAVCPECGTSPT